MTMINELKLIDQREIMGKDFKIYGNINNPLFLAKDVANWIGNKNVSQMIKTAELSEDEKGIYLIDTLGGKQELLFVTEDGLYELLMQSRKPNAKEFKRQVKIILKTIRKTGGFIADPETMVNTYFNTLDDNHKGLVLGLFQNVEEQQKIIMEQKLEIDHKGDIIKGLIEDIPLASKRQILNRVVMKCSNFNDRWKELYFNFEQKYKIRLGVRMEFYNKTHKSQLRSKLEYIEVIGMIDELYSIACKLYESEVNVLVEEMYRLHEIV